MLRIFIACIVLCAPLFAEMTIEEKVGQLIIVHCHENDAKTIVQDLHVGGVILYGWANDLSTHDKVLTFISYLQSLAKTPLFIATDQEGGIIATIPCITPSPSNRALGIIGNPTLAQESAYVMGLELKALGVNLNFAPVVDIQDFAESRLGQRIYGGSPYLVIKMARGAIEGFQKAGILTCLKHFPGLGNLTIDSHDDTPVVRKSLEELENFEMRPFRELRTDFVMTAHLLVPALDQENCVTLSPKAISYLREHFDGIIITDSLVMEGLLKQCTSVEEAAIRAIEAGCDIVLLGGKLLLGSGKELSVSEIESIHSALVAAVKSGRISIDASLERIFRVKQLLDDTQKMQ